MSLGIEQVFDTSPRLGASSTILIDLPLIWMQQKRSRSPVRTHMPFLSP
jgi:hypothetical protein